MRHAGLILVDVLDALQAALRAGRQHRRAGRHRRAHHRAMPAPSPRSRATARNPPFPGQHLRLDQRRGGARHPVAAPAHPRRATWSAWTSAASGRAGTPTAPAPGPSARRQRRWRELIDATRRGMEAGIAAARARQPPRRRGRSHRGGRQRARLRDRAAVRRPRHRARPCTRIRRSRTTAGRAPGCGSRRACASPSSRCSTSAATTSALLDDGWTVVTADGSLSAHFENTIAVTDHGPEVLTHAMSVSRVVPEGRC